MHDILNFEMHPDLMIRGTIRICQKNQDNIIYSINIDVFVKSQNIEMAIEKRLTNKLFILYSFIIAYGEEQVEALKYQITNNINLILQRSEFGSLGGDIQLGVSFD